jgi:hypothetical protein
MSLLTLSTLTLIQTIATFMLLVWAPTKISSKGIRLVLFITSGFFGTVFLMAGLFSLWWPPKQPFVVLWSAITLGLLLLTMVRAEEN